MGKRSLCNTEKFCSCCCPRIVLNLERRFVFHIVTAELIENLSDCDVAIVTLKHRETKAILPKKNIKKDNIQVTIHRLRDLPEWSEEFTDSPEDTEVPGLANTSHDSDSERTTKVATRKRSMETHFQRDRNCEICKRTKRTRVPCRRRIGETVSRAEKFGDLISADHKVLNEGSESRHSHRYSIVVQDQATQWIQSYPCRTKTSQETEKSSRKFLEPSEKVKVIYTDNFIGIWQILWRFIMESSYLYTSSI